jgi:hypothetical protein
MSQLDTKPQLGMGEIIIRVEKRKGVNSNAITKRKNGEYQIKKEI